MSNVVIIPKKVGYADFSSKDDSSRDYSSKDYSSRDYSSKDYSSRGRFIIRTVQLKSIHQEDYSSNFEATPQQPLLIYTQDIFSVK